jgi:hypothetical protein
MVLRFTASADGNINRITGSADMNMEIDAGDIPATIKVSFALSIDLGVPVAIDPPDDLDTYEEIDDTYVMPEDLLDF